MRIEGVEFYKELLGDYFDIRISDYNFDGDLDRIRVLDRKLREEELDFVSH